MSKKSAPRTNWRVTVEHDATRLTWRRTGESPKDFEARQSDLGRIACEEIASAIRRHVDNVANVYVESDAKFVCEFCGAPWTEGNDPYNGGCCDKDCEAEDARIASNAVPTNAAQSEGGEP